MPNLKPSQETFHTLCHIEISCLLVLFEYCLPKNNIVTVCFSHLGDTGSLNYAWSSKFCHILLCNIKALTLFPLLISCEYIFLISGSLLGWQCFHGSAISGLFKEYIKWKKATNSSSSDLCLFYSYSLFICLHFEKCMEGHIFFIL